MFVDILKTLWHGFLLLGGMFVVAFSIFSIFVFLDDLEDEYPKWIGIYGCVVVIVAVLFVFGLICQGGAIR